MLRRQLLLVAAALGALLAPSAANGEEIARPARATPVDADLGVVAWSVYDAQTRRFGIAVRAGAGPMRLINTPTSTVPFELDVGDDAGGRRVVVYAAYDAGFTRRDILLHRLDDGSDRAVPVAARADRDEHAPTISRGVLAWAVGNGSRAARPRVLTHPLGSARRPRALPALPPRRCFDAAGDGRVRCATLNGVVEELELRGTALAQVIVGLAFGYRDRELRLVDTRRGTSASVLSIGVGESGQRLLGPSFDGNHLYAYKACFGDPSGCNIGAGTFRFGLGDGRLALASSRRQRSGFAVDGGMAFTAEGEERRLCEVEQGGYEGLSDPTIGPCPITSQPLPTTFRTVRRP